MISVIEKPKKPALRVIRKSSELFVNEVPDIFYIGKAKLQKTEPENEPEPESEIGLPPQPKEYLKYPDYDWF
jgi:hypothetical protein